jgi:hypothetical protein
MATGAGAGFVVLLDQLVTGVGAPAVDPERGDPERAPDRAHVDARDRDWLELVETEDLVHGA